MAELDQKKIEELKNELGVLADISENNDLFKSISSLMDMPEEDFLLIAPGIMQSYQQSLNNPNDSLVLAQALNASGVKIDDLISEFDEMEETINKMPLPACKKDFLKELIYSILNTINNTEGIAKRIVRVPIELCDKNAKVPQYAHNSDSGMDVYALDDITIKPGETVLVPTGIKVALPPGYELQVRPKSGRCLKTKMRVANAPGTVDQGYRDEVGIIIDNIEPPIKDINYEYHVNGEETYCVIRSILHGEDFTIGKGEKFCQLVLAEVPKVSWNLVDSVLNIGEDRGGGFGSTGLK